ncbi:hypothetical protein QEN19_002601 [Hanseniaspora menglaensis]
MCRYIPTTMLLNKQITAITYKTLTSKVITTRLYNSKFTKYQKSPSPSSLDDVPDIIESNVVSENEEKKKIYATKPLEEVVNQVSLKSSSVNKIYAINEGEINWATSFKGLSQEPFSAEACKILQLPIAKIDVEIKPDGILYLPEIKYRRILNKAFGPGAWGLVPRSEPVIINGNIVTRDYALVILGRLVSLCSGEQTFFGDDQIITALEGCKSNALMRCCKDLGIASELWDPLFIGEFKTKNCKAQIVEHIKTKAKKRVWMKNSDNTPPYPFKLSR